MSYSTAIIYHYITLWVSACCSACVVIMQCIIPPWCGFEHVPTSPQTAVTGGFLWAAECVQPSRQYSWPLRAGLLKYGTSTTTITTVCHQLNLGTCTNPLSLSLFSQFLSVFLSLLLPYIQQQQVCHQLGVDTCAFLLHFFLFFRSPFFHLFFSSLSVCFNSSVMGLVAS